jgi:hypothetical protein
VALHCIISAIAKQDAAAKVVIAMAFDLRPDGLHALNSMTAPPYFLIKTQPKPKSPPAI